MSRSERAARNEEMVALRKEGHTFADIGRRFGITGVTVKSVLWKAERDDHINREWLRVMSRTAVKVLRKLGFNSREEVMQAHREALLYSMLKAYTPSGVKTIKEIHDWLGVKEPALPVGDRVRRAIQMLEGIGYKVTKVDDD